MDTNITNSPADRRSTDRQASHPADEIAISAIDLIKMIESGQGTDVNELVNQVLQDRQVA